MPLLEHHETTLNMQQQTINNLKGDINQLKDPVNNHQRCPTVQEIVTEKTTSHDYP